MTLFHVTLNPEIVIFNIPFGIVHSGIRQKESLIPMQSSPRDRALVPATAWERNTQVQGTYWV